MMRIITQTFAAAIYCGLKSEDGCIHSRMEAYKICQDYVDERGMLQVSFTDTEFIYTAGNEEGVIVGLINNNPRFPLTENDITNHAIRLAELLLEGLVQRRITIVMPRQTIIINRD